MNASDIQPTLAETIAIKQHRAIDERALRTLFAEARTANAFLDAPVPRDLIERAIDIAELGPTSANTLPVRYVIVESAAGKEKLKPALMPTNVDKTMAAPAVVIVAADLKFYENIARTFPTRPEMAARFTAPDAAEMSKAHARDNALLQMGYFTIAVRALGLDAGPMGGFDRANVDAAFFPDGRFMSLYLINIGYGDDTKSFPRLPRLNADEIATFV